MEEVRIIISTDGKNEFVFFTSSDDPAGDFIRPGCKVVSDQKIQWEEPLGFPLESMLHNVG